MTETFIKPVHSARVTKEECRKTNHDLKKIQVMGARIISSLRKRYARVAEISISGGNHERVA